MSLPRADTLAAAQTFLEPHRSRRDELLRTGYWESALAEIDLALLIEVMGLNPADAASLHTAAARLRARPYTREQRTRMTSDADVFSGSESNSGQRRSHSPWQRAAVAKSCHTSLRSLQKYACPSADALAQLTTARGAERRRG